MLCGALKPRLSRFRRLPHSGQTYTHLDPRPDVKRHKQADNPGTIPALPAPAEGASRARKWGRATCVWGSAT